MTTYVFIGHGWNLDTFIFLQKFNCEGVLALARPELLMEENRDFKKLYKEEKEKKKRFLYHLLKPDHKINDFCLYTETCPEMLLTTFQKIGEDNFLLNIDRKTEIDLQDQKVFLLSEILFKIAKKEKDFKFIVYSCRAPLTSLQKDNLFVFKEGEQKIRDYINSKNIEVVRDMGFITKCKLLDDEVLNILSGDKEKDEKIEAEKALLKEIKDRYDNDIRKVYKLLSEVARSLYNIHKQNKYIVDISRDDIQKIDGKFEIIGKIRNTNEEEKFFKNIEELLEDIEKAYHDENIKEKIHILLESVTTKHRKEYIKNILVFGKNKPRKYYEYNYPSDSTSFIDIVDKTFNLG